MRAVIIPDDGFVSVNGRGLSPINLSWIPPHVHAVVWNETSGEVQVRNPQTRAIIRNEPLASLDAYQYAFELWEARRLVVDAPPTAATLEQRRAACWEAVKEERSRRKDGGVQAGGHWFQTDSDSRIQLMRLDSKATAAIAAGGLPTDVLTVAGQPIYWKTTDNGLVPMTVALAQGVVSAVEVLDALAFARAETLRAQIMASNNPESINITTGWPAVYGPA